MVLIWSYELKLCPSLEKWWNCVPFVSNTNGSVVRKCSTSSCAESKAKPVYRSPGWTTTFSTFIVCLPQRNIIILYSHLWAYFRSFKRFSFLSPPGFLSPQYSEEHGLHLPPWQKLSDQQSDSKPLPVLPPPEVLWGWHVQRRWEESSLLNNLRWLLRNDVPLRVSVPVCSCA